MKTKPVRIEFEIIRHAPEAGEPADYEVSLMECRGQDGPCPRCREDEDRDGPWCNACAVSEEIDLEGAQYFLDSLFCESLEEVLGRSGTLVVAGVGAWDRWRPSDSCYDEVDFDFDLETMFFVDEPVAVYR